jgi:proteasome lid subunit RPN8/RPN11
VSDTRLRIPEGLVQRMRAHGAEAYPHECCGALLGHDGETSREVLDLLPLTNRRNDSPRNRFELAPDDVRVAEQTARERHLELIGWYHSHPDAPAWPSEFDRQHAWPWYSYIILRVEKGEAQEVTSWRLHDDRGAYDSESIVCQGTNSAAPLAAIVRERV